MGIYRIAETAAGMIVRKIYKQEKRGDIMSKSARSLFIFSLYLFLLGTVLIVIPNVLLTIFWFPETKEVWIRIVGMLVFILGFYYFQASRNEIKKFFQWTVFGRIAVFIFLLVFVLLNFTPPTLIIFGVIDAVAAIWTQLCLLSDKKG